MKVNILSVEDTDKSVWVKAELSFDYNELLSIVSKASKPDYFTRNQGLKIKISGGLFIAPRRVVPSFVNKMLHLWLSKHPEVVSLVSEKKELSIFEVYFGEDMLKNPTVVTFTIS